MLDRSSEPCLLRRSGLYSKLKPGPGQTAEEVRAHQRVRLHGATVDLVADRGFSGLTVRGIVQTSGVSTKTFYDHFKNVEECFVSTYRAVVGSAAKTLAGNEEESDPVERLRTGLRALMTQVVADPAPARLALVDVFDAGPALVAEIDHSVETLARAIASVFDAGAGSADSSPPLLHLAVVGGVERTIRKRLLESQHGELLDLTDELFDWALVLLTHRHEPSRPKVPAGRARTRSPATNFRAGDFGPPGDVRGRSLAATANLAVREGYWNLTAARICEEACVSRRDFGGLFGDVSEPFLDAIEALAIRAAAGAWHAGVMARDWREGIVRSANALCMSLLHNPPLGRLFFVDALEPGGEGLRRREALVATATAELARLLLGPSTPAGAGTEAAVAAAMTTLRSATTTEDPTYLHDAVPIVTHALLASYTSAPRSNGNAIEA